jgi:PIN domain nuclease of toxin-antitoxin system
VSPDARIVDASATLAYIFAETGHDIVGESIARGAVISSVNLAEVHSTLLAQGVASSAVVARLKASGLDVEPFEEGDAGVVGALRPLTRSLGLSLADRACLALGIRLGRAVLTADRMLAEAEVGVEVRAIR